MRRQTLNTDKGSHKVVLIDTLLKFSVSVVGTEVFGRLEEDCVCIISLVE